MKRKIAACLICVCLLVSLPAGCGKKALSLNPDGTIGGLKWGMTAQEAGSAWNTMIVPDGNGRFRLDGFSLMGTVATVYLRFGTGGLDIPEARLEEIYINFPADKDMDELVKELSAVFGAEGMNEQGYWRWKSEQTLGEKLNDGEKAAALPYAEAFLSSVQEMSGDEYAAWLNDRPLVTAVLEVHPLSTACLRCGQRR